MKTYDSDVRLKTLDFNLDNIDYRKIYRTNEEILNTRWDNTDKALKMALPKLKRIYSRLADEVLSLLSEIDFSYQKIHENVPKRIRRIVNNRISDWKEAGICNGYLEYLCKTHKWTYGSVLLLLIAGLYAKKYKSIRMVSNDVFIVAAVDAYNQNLTDRSKTDFPLLSMTTILGFAVMPVLGNTYVEYLDSLMLDQIEEMNSYIISSAMVNIEIDDEKTLIVVQKQLNRILNIHDGKFSGGLDDAARAVSNKAYIHNTEDDKDLQARFVAEMDEKTTKMCRSLDDQLFYVNRMNHFIRYSDSRGGYVNVECEGLVPGLNLPPISDHFHWCRSTITYQTELSREKIAEMMGRTGSKESNDDTKASKHYSFKKQFDLDLEKSGDPKVELSDKIVVNGVTYEADDVIPNTNKAGEYEGAEFLRKTFGVDVKLMPEVKQRKNVKKINSYDYLVDNSDEPWDCKAGITSTSKEVFKNNISQKQATSYLFDIRNCKYEDGSRISDAYIDEIVDYTFKTRKYVNCIVVKDSNKLVGVYYNKKG